RIGEQRFLRTRIGGYTPATTVPASIEVPLRNRADDSQPEILSDGLGYTVPPLIVTICSKSFKESLI
ncbi:MAG: hypothetical protein Q6K18_06515, partial [Gloeomargarita sp. DG_1_5_bins_55]